MQYPGNNKKDKTGSTLGRQERAFTLIEVLIASLLLGLAIASLIAAGTSVTRTNAAGVNLSTAEFLVEQIRELAATTDYDNLNGFDMASFCPPIDADQAVLTQFPNFEQQITVENVSDTNFNSVVVDGGSSFKRVTVDVLYNSRTICSSSWLRADIPD